MKNTMKIAVLMSGGIDSSFAALSLKKQGFDVFGITFLQLGGEVQKKDLERAKKVAECLAIPHFTIKAKSDFDKKVVSYFCEGFKKGITPNPCCFCNKEIKFGLALDKAIKLGAQKIATGHYVRLMPSTNSEFFTNERMFRFVNSSQIRYSLMKAKDKNKDQSYFLWQLIQKELKKAIFPLGDFTKKKIWQEIKKSPLSKFFKDKNNRGSYSESQDICFLKGKSISDFLEANLKINPGKILDKKGNVLENHNGIQFFTIGQREGLKIGAKSPNQKPLYVIKKDYKANTIIVGSEKDLYKKELVVKNINWTSGKSPNFPIEVKAQIRYRAKPQKAIIKKLSQNNYKIEFKTSQRAITPGQHIVFYKRDLLLGGGVIKQSLI